MGQKVNPVGFRVGIKVKRKASLNKELKTSNVIDWRSRWIAEKKYFGHMLFEDQMIRKHIYQNYKEVGISKIEIERVKDEIRVIIYSEKATSLYGKKGQRRDTLKEKLEKITNSKVEPIIEEVKQPAADATLVAQSIALNIEKRVSFRRAMKKAIDTSKDTGIVKGIKVMVSGRLGGAEMSRSEYAIWGSIPLQTIRGNVDYGFAEAGTTYGIIGCKCWIYKGDIDEQEDNYGSNAKKS